MTDVSLDGDYDFWYDIVKIEGNIITCCGGRLGEFAKEVKSGKDGEYFYVEHKGFYEEAFKGGKPSRIKCVPFLDDGEHEFKPEIEPPRNPKEFKLMKKQEEYCEDPNQWTTKCIECGATMHFNKNNFTYYCSKCGNVLEV